MFELKKTYQVDLTTKEVTQIDDANITSNKDVNIVTVKADDEEEAIKEAEKMY